jgi:thymidine phosphorylase
VAELRADRPGVVVRIDARALGETVVSLGGGRRREDDRIDPTVGISHLVSLGESITEGQPLARVHAADGPSAEEAARQVAAALTFTAAPVTPPPLIRETLR